MRHRFNINRLITLGLASVMCVAIGRIHLRVQTTLLGYDIAELKENESKLLEERSHLKMQLSKLTTKKHLVLMTESLEGSQSSKSRMALK